MRSTSSLLLASLALAPLCLFAARGAASSLDPATQQELSSDFSLGKVVDREGVAMARAATSERWESADENRALFAGTTVKTGARGANALHVRLKSGASLILGPDALVELVDANRVARRARRGRGRREREGAARRRRAGGASLDVATRRVVRARDGKLLPLDDDPKWLAGYKSGQSTEALGSLLANGRRARRAAHARVPKVTVDVPRPDRAHRDRGVVRQPHRPRCWRRLLLPAAGRRVDLELRHVDRRRAGRGRHRREGAARAPSTSRSCARSATPASSKWTGGNVFKARVYPIGGEKRMKIAYTQVLPKDGDASPTTMRCRASS
jgi:hypothetical protein